MMSMAKPIAGETLTGRERILRACRGEPVDRVPIWLMRQAGRYLPEYREVRARAGFEALCKTPDLATEVTLQPLRRFPLDAAIVFSDIMMPAEAMGLGLAFNPGPVITPPVRSRRDVERLAVPENGEGLEYIAEAIARLRRELGERGSLRLCRAPLTPPICEDQAADRGRGGSGGKGFRPRRSSTPTLASPTSCRAVARVIMASSSEVRRSRCGAAFDTWAGPDPPRLPDPACRTPRDRRRGPRKSPRHACRPRRRRGRLLEMEETGADVISLDRPPGAAPAGSAAARAGEPDPVLLASPAHGRAGARVLRLAAAAAIFNLDGATRHPRAGRAARRRRTRSSPR
jgi:hypothetical protein